jgi:hypothetical protein
MYRDRCCARPKRELAGGGSSEQIFARNDRQHAESVAQFVQHGRLTHSVAHGRQQSAPSPNTATGNLDFGVTQVRNGLLDHCSIN